MTAIQVDWTISLGNVVMAVSFLLTCIGIAARVRADMIVAAQKLVEIEKTFGSQVQDIKNQVNEIRGNMKELATALITVARQDERMGYMQSEIIDLKKQFSRVEGVPRRS